MSAHANDPTPSLARIVVLTVSDRSARGERDDASGPAAQDALNAVGFSNVVTSVIPDGEDSVREALTAAAAEGADLVLTLGGTGIGPRDATPEATRAVVDIELPGLSELIRARGLVATPTAALTRGVSGVVGSTLVINLPGSPKAVRESLEVLLPVIPHALHQLGGGDH